MNEAQKLMNESDTCIVVTYFFAISITGYERLANITEAASHRILRILIKFQFSLELLG